MSEDWRVEGFQPTVIDEGTYPADVIALKKRPGFFGDDYCLWVFHPHGFDDDVEVAGSTSLAAGRNSKGMEWARRILGKSKATDMKWGKDLRERRPVVNWGPQELVGRKCRIVVEPYYNSDEDAERCRVVNVLPPEDVIDDVASSEEEDFKEIPF